MANDAAQLKKDLNRFVIEGSLNTVFGTLIGGAFLVGFALALGAEDSHIGMLAAMPPLLNLVQILGSYLVQRVGSSKKVCLITSALFRLAWLFIALMPMLVMGELQSATGIVVLILAIAVASLFASLSGIAWMSWVTPLVPETVRGRFFGFRNMIASLTGMLIALAAGRFIDFWQTTHSDPTAMISGYSLMFGVAVLFGFLGLLVLSRVSDVRAVPSPTGDSFLSQLRKPIQDSGFRRWIIFAACWSFSVGVASPFFSVYMIRTLAIPFSLIATLGLVSGMFNTFGMRLWGSVIDEIGSKTLLLVCSIVGGGLPLLWLLATPDNIGILWFINVLTGLAWSGIGLSTSQLLMSAAPREGSSVYFAVFAAITGLSGAVAPLAGGSLVQLLPPMQLDTVTISSVQMIFVITASLRLLSLVLLQRVPAAKEMSIQETVVKLRELSNFQMLRGGQHLSTLSIHLENTLSNVSAGALHLEGRVERIVDRGIHLAKRAEAKSQKVDAQLNKSLDAWEKVLDRIITPVAKTVRKLYDFLTKE